MNAHAKLNEQTAAMLADATAGEAKAKEIAEKLAAVLAKAETFGQSEAGGLRSKFDLCELFRNGVLDGTFKYHIDEAKKLVAAYAKGYNAAKHISVDPMKESTQTTTTTHVMSFGHPAVTKQDIKLYERVRDAFDGKLGDTPLNSDTRIKGSAFNAMYVVNGKIKAAAEAQVAEVTLLVTDNMLVEWLRAADAKVKDAAAKLDDAIKAVVRAGKADTKYMAACEAAADVLKMLAAGKKLPDALYQLIEKAKG